MAGVDLSQKALEQLQDSVNGRATDIVKLKDGKPMDKTPGEFGAAFPGKKPASKVFGKLADSEGLASAVDTVEQKVSDELDAAKHRLDGVERALDQVRRNIRTADKASTGKDEK
ncbi:hypothetical protein ABT294_05225 [Nonomuraea sp. NPDC000554]|uniref:hypothetical protein n=1 Tax=Nonomuraea sp. NPDC000554 TaxID=3154259 RepID=UPI003322C686